MNRRRSAVIALQAAVVGVVALVVALTLLQPDGDDPLFDVSTPEDAGRVEIRQDRDERGDRVEADENDGNGDSGRDARDNPRLGLVGPGAGEGTGAGSGQDTLGLSPVPSTLPLGTTGSPADSSGSGDDDSPTGDQYSDALARLTAKLD